MLRGKCLRHLQNLPISNNPASTQTGSGESEIDLFTESATYSHAPVLAHLLARQFFDKENSFSDSVDLFRVILETCSQDFAFTRNPLSVKVRGKRGWSFVCDGNLSALSGPQQTSQWLWFMGSLTCNSSDVLEGSWAVDSVSSYRGHPAWLHEWLQELNHPTHLENFATVVPGWQKQLMKSIPDNTTIHCKCVHVCFGDCLQVPMENARWGGNHLCVFWHTTKSSLHPD